MIRLNQIKIKIEDNEQKLNKLIAKNLKIKEKDINYYNVIKRSLDARDNDQIYYVYSLDVDVKNERAILNKNKKLTPSKKREYRLPTLGPINMKYRPIIIGFGPAGMFASLILAEMGLKPIVFERGSEVNQRIEDVEHFWNQRKLNVNSNMQFGEGGAGTFSDGKLTTRVKDIRGRKVLDEFVLAGANEEILYVHNPHIGTDVLVDVVKNIRSKIISLGGEIHFNSKMDDLTFKEGQVESITVNNKNYKTNDLILAIGHSARDTFELLVNKGIEIKQKPFAVGLRIEHPQQLINISQYGEKYHDFPKLGSAEYKLTHKASNGKSIYSFCMCPGGTVVGCSSEVETVVVNGMSEYARDKENANSAVVCTVDEKDFKSQDPLAGMEFQRLLEKKAYQMGGNNYDAPVQLVKDFLDNKESIKLGTVKPSYTLGFKFSNLNTLFPTEISEALKEAIIHMDHKLKGFKLEDAVLTGVETRTSSPIRIVRESDSLESVNRKGLYPTGEGAGYAGGIMSAAIDGVKVAETIINKYKNK